MAANFWASSHFRELLDPEDVDVVHQLDKERGMTLEDFKLIKLHMANSLLSGSLAYALDYWKHEEMLMLLTAFKKISNGKSLTEYDPRVVAPTCLYLAAKAEESTVQARLLVFYIKKMHSDEKYRIEIKEILDMEMKILEALNYNLVVFHPYRSLSQLLQDAGMNDATQLVWGIVNDTYKMDLMLMYPPHLIALACIYIASVLRDKENIAWFEELRVDMNVVKNIAMEILDFYDSFKLITDDRINTAINKLAR